MGFVVRLRPDIAFTPWRDRPDFPSEALFGRAVRAHTWSEEIEGLPRMSLASRPASEPSLAAHARLDENLKKQKAAGMFRKALADLLLGGEGRFLGRFSSSVRGPSCRKNCLVL